MDIKEVKDLTHDMAEGMLTFGAHWHVPFTMNQLGRHGVEGRETRQVSFGTHTGTQVDAPLHFIKDGKSIEQVSPEVLLGKVSIFDFSHKKKGDHVSLSDLEALTLSERVVFFFNWAQYWPDKEFYEGYPYFTEEAAKCLVEQGVKLIGFDSPSPDDPKTKLAGDVLGTDTDSPVHKILLSRDVAIAEYLANLDQLKGDFEGWNIAAMPLRLKGADGSPARIFLFR